MSFPGSRASKGGVTAFSASQRFGHPLLILPQRFGHPPVPSWDAQIPSVLVILSKKNSGFRGKIENVLEVDSAKYGNLFHYRKKKVYPQGFTRQDKTTLRKFAKKFEYDSKLESLFYDLLLGQGEGWHSASTCYHRAREREGLLRVPLCSVFWTRRPR